MVASSGATIITGSLGTEEINSCQVISNQNTHQTDTEVIPNLIHYHFSKDNQKRIQTIK